MKVHIFELQRIMWWYDMIDHRSYAHNLSSCEILFFFQLNTQKVPRKLLLCTFWCQTPKEKQKLLFNPQQLKQADLSFYNGVLHEVHDTLKNTSATLKNYPDLFISSVLMMNIFVICINTLSLITSNLFKYADKVTDLSDYILNVFKYLSFNFYKSLLF